MTSPITSTLTRPLTYKLTAPLGSILGQGGGGVPPVTPPIISFDRTNNVFKVNGSTVANETAGWQTLNPNAVVSEQTVVTGSVAIGPELVVNGNFDTDTSGWTPAQSSGGPATFVWSSGTGVLTPNSSALPYAYQYVAGIEPGESYILSGDETRAGSDTFILTTPDTIFGYAPPGGMGQTTNGTGHKTGSFVSCLSRNRVGLRNLVNPGTSLSTFDNISIKKVRPFSSGWQRRHRWIISAVAPTAQAANQYLLHLGHVATNSGNDYDHISVFRRSSDGHVVVEQKTAMCQFNTYVYNTLDLGAVTDGASITVELQTCNPIKAKLNSGSYVVGVACAPTNYPQVVIGQAPYAGTSVWNASITSIQLDLVADADSAFSIIGLGHSLPFGTNSLPTAGATGATWFSRLCNTELSGAAWYQNLGIGGQTSQQIRDRMYNTGATPDDMTLQPAVSDPRTVLVIWALENDTGTTSIANIDDIVTKWGQLNSAQRFVIVEPMAWADGSNAAVVGTQRTSLRSSYGTHCIDMAGYCCTPTIGTGGVSVGDSCQALDDAGIAVASQNANDKSDFQSGYLCSSLRSGTGSDKIHPNSLGGIPLSKPFAPKFTALGYS